MISQTYEPILMPDYKLRFRPSLLEHRYGMLIRHFEGEQETLKLHYGLSVASTGDSKGERPEVSVDREQVYINNHAPDLLAEQFANDIGKCVFPVKLSLNTNGTLDEVTNEVEIRSRWNNAKAALGQYYKGNVADTVFEHMDAQLSSGKYITGNLKRDIFFALYFQALYYNYTSGGARSSDIHFPFIAFGTPVLFAGTCTPESDDTGNKLVLRLKGNCTDERSYKDIINRKILPSQPGGNSSRGFLDLSYKLYPDTHVIYAVTGLIQLSDGGNNSRSIAVELFHQPEEGKPSGAKRKEPVNIIEDVPVANRKPFWALFKK